MDLHGPSYPAVEVPMRHVLGLVLLGLVGCDGDGEPDGPASIDSPTLQVRVLQSLEVGANDGVMVNLTAEDRLVTVVPVLADPEGVLPSLTFTDGIQHWGVPQDPIPSMVIPADGEAPFRVSAELVGEQLPAVGRYEREVEIVVELVDTTSNEEPERLPVRMLVDVE